MSILIKGMEMPKNEELIIICSNGTDEYEMLLNNAIKKLEESEE